MRNPDPWRPPEPDEEPAKSARRSALLGLLLVAMLVIGGLYLSHVLSGAARLQDCALSGRSNCSGG
ncbi:MAG TPA: hypothetical protein VGI65_15360 [Steroidobacteraceae bacterium]|jgi:hypothetical protein